MIKIDPGKLVPAELTPSEREEMIRLRAENERLRTEIAVVKKEIALREEKTVLVQELRNDIVNIS